ncbi:MAG TPA: TetR/AcrR family transcriptional regulator [Jatrophihabitantaceae bacterium]
MDELTPPPWQRVPQRGTGRRRDPLTREQIVDAALKLLDAEGLDGFSMRRLATELGTGAASLYWHVGSKDGLLDLIFDRVISEQPVPDPEPGRWQEQLTEVAHSMRASILRHRDIVRISIGRIPMGPNALRYMERVLAILRSAGLPDELAVHGFHLLTSAVNGFTMDETGQGGDPPADQPPLDEFARMARDYIAGLPADQFPNMVAVADQFAMSDPDARFDLLVDLFVSGLARHAEVARTPARKRPAGRQRVRPAR